MKILNNIFDFFFYGLLKEKHRQAIKNLLSEKQKQRLRVLFQNGRRAYLLKQVRSAKFKMLNLGMFEEGFAELVTFSKSKNNTLKALASKELALYHANKYTNVDMFKSLNYIDIYAKHFKKDQKIINEIVIQRVDNFVFLKEYAKAEETLSLFNGENADYFLAKANIKQRLDEKLSVINDFLKKEGLLTITLTDEEDKSPYDQLVSKIKNSKKIINNGPKVSVLMPAYNAERFIKTAIESILNQTWTNLELIVIDDHSTDQTKTIVDSYAKKDRRLKVVQTPKNGGAYQARNTGLKYATGEYVTVNDADDWSHPEKIARQMQHLISNPEVVANTSSQSRMTNDLVFYRRGAFGRYVFSNMSSLLFKKSAIDLALGYWDSVRFAGDSEFIKRIKRIYGEHSVIDLDTPPLSFTRQDENSLTANSAFGYHGYLMGVRKEYAECHVFYHAASTADNLYYAYQMEKRPFPVPKPMELMRPKVNEHGERYVKTLIVSDFRAGSEHIAKTISYLRRLVKENQSFELVQLSNHDVDPTNNVDERIRYLQYEKQFTFAVHGEKIQADRVVLMSPIGLLLDQQHLPQVSSRNIELNWQGETPSEHVLVKINSRVEDWIM